MRTLNCVMLVDDSATDLFLHKRAVAGARCAERVVTFQRAREAFDALRAGRESPELILLDINMPGMNGWDFLEAFGTLPPPRKASTRVMLVTTSVNPDDRERAMKNPEVSGFLNKPLSPELCQEMVVRFFPD